MPAGGCREVSDTRVVVQLGEVAFAELSESTRHVTKPEPKLGAGSHAFTLPPPRSSVP